jgi:hypothetical protein
MFIKRTEASLLTASSFLRGILRFVRFCTNGRPSLFGAGCLADHKECRRISASCSFSDGGTDIREVQSYLNPEGEQYLDWFHVTMRITVLGQGTASHMNYIVILIAGEVKLECVLSGRTRRTPASATGSCTSASKLGRGAPYRPCRIRSPVPCRFRAVGYHCHFKPHNSDTRDPASYRKRNIAWLRGLSSRSMIRATSSCGRMRSASVFLGFRSVNAAPTLNGQ